MARGDEACSDLNASEQPQCVGPIFNGAQTTANIDHRQGYIAYSVGSGSWGVLTPFHKISGHPQVDVYVSKWWGTTEHHFVFSPLDRAIDPNVGTWLCGLLVPSFV